MPSKDLYLSGNHVGNETLLAFGQALSHPSCNLQTLSLTNNSITEAKALGAAVALASCPLITLYLDGNKVST